MSSSARGAWHTNTNMGTTCDTYSGMNVTVYPLFEDKLISFQAHKNLTSEYCNPLHKMF